jgi:hypothetical protein
MSRLLLPCQGSRWRPGGKFGPPSLFQRLSQEILFIVSGYLGLEGSSKTPIEGVTDAGYVHVHSSLSNCIAVV